MGNDQLTMARHHRNDSRSACLLPGEEVANLLIARPCINNLINANPGKARLYVRVVTGKLYREAKQWQANRRK